MLQEGTYPFIMKNRILGALSATERKSLKKGRKKCGKKIEEVKRKTRRTYR